MQSGILKHQKLIGRTDEISSLLYENKRKRKNKKEKLKALKSLCCLVLRIQLILKLYLEN